MSAANERNAELTGKQDILSQRLADLYRRLAAVLDHV